MKELGVRAVLEKPFVFDELLRFVHAFARPSGTLSNWGDALPEARDDSDSCGIPRTVELWAHQMLLSSCAVVTAATFSPRSQPHEAPFIKRRPSVLIVDDDRDVREMLTTALRMAGFDVWLAVDGITALQQVEHRAPDIVLLDLDLPVVNGIAVHQELVSHNDTRDLPVIILTGTDWHSPFRTFATLRKPVDPGTLVSVLRRALV